MGKRVGSRFSFLSRKRQWLLVIGIVVAVCTLLAACYFVAQKIEASSVTGEEPRGSLEGRFEQPLRIEYQGASYEKKQRLTTILLMGIDKGAERPQQSSGLRDGGQADFLALMVIDEKEKTTALLHIDRDAMTEITTLGIFGNVSGTRRAQISLQHGFGDGEEQSAHLTVDAVSELFLGMSIDHYIAFNMDIIAAFNDLLGGVVIRIEDDFSALDTSMIKGNTQRLNGQQAVYFVRSRMEVGDGSNASRMIRQRDYLSAASDQLSQRLKEDVSFASSLLNNLSSAMRSDMYLGRMINEIDATRDYERLPIQSLKGTHRVSQDGFMEFEVDQAALEQLILKLFFNKL